MTLTLPRRALLTTSKLLPLRPMHSSRLSRSVNGPLCPSQRTGPHSFPALLSRVGTLGTFIRQVHIINPGATISDDGLERMTLMFRNIELIDDGNVSMLPADNIASDPAATDSAAAKKTPAGSSPFRVKKMQKRKEKGKAKKQRRSTPGSKASAAENNPDEAKNDPVAMEITKDDVAEDTLPDAPPVRDPDIDMLCDAPPAPETSMLDTLPDAPPALEPSIMDTLPDAPITPDADMDTLPDAPTTPATNMDTLPDAPPVEQSTTIPTSSSKAPTKRPTSPIKNSKPTGLTKSHSSKSKLSFTVPKTPIATRNFLERIEAVFAAGSTETVAAMRQVVRERNGRVTGLKPKGRKV